LSYDAEEEQQYQVFIAKAINEPIPPTNHKKELAF
jgi:hypothetical protein